MLHSPTSALSHIQSAFQVKNPKPLFGLNLQNKWKQQPDLTHMSIFENKLQFVLQ